MNERRGGCLCGGVRFEARGELAGIDLCHCRNCQKATGQPFFARAVVAHTEVAVTGEITWYASSPGFQRGFCPTCGATLFARRLGGERLSIALAAFDEAAELRPQTQVWASRRVPWLACLDENFPAWPEFPPR